MLHWLAGKPHDGNNADPDTTGYIEPPETPAPVFAVRAFKHAIFGTPGTEKPKAPRRHSNSENARNGAGSRPRLLWPKSSSDAATLGRLEDAVAPPSPTKGILMTPGTAAGKRKTVTFPDHVMDNEEKRPLKSGLPDDCPGKFPSPWNKSVADTEHIEEIQERPRGLGNLNEALEQARDESVKRKVRLGKPNRSHDKAQDDQDRTVDLVDPKSESGKYWKNEYDIYRERTTREVKKLVAKQKAAKNFAREKDNECIDLADELRQETKRAEKFERRALDLEKQLEDLQKKLESSQRAAQATQEELERLKKGFGTMSYRRPSESASNPSQAGRPEIERKSGRSAKAQPQPPAVPAHTSVVAAPDESRKAAAGPLEEEGAQPRPRRKLRDVQAKAENDIWAPSSSVGPGTGDRAPNVIPSVIAGIDSTPLKPLSVNSRNQDTMSVAMDMGLRPPSPQREKRQDSPLASTVLLSHTPEPAKSEARANISILIPESGAFDSDTTHENAPPSPLAQKSAQKAAIEPVDSKENISPTRPRSRDGQQKPMAAWNAMNGVDSRRPVNRTNREVSEHALAKARERLRVGGRKVS